MFKYLLLFITLFAYSKLSAQGSNTCAGAAANPITLPFFGNNQSTCGDGNDYTGNNPCIFTATGNYYGGQDWLYSFTPNQDGYVSILLNDVVATGTAYPVITLSNACPGTFGACMGFSLYNPSTSNASIVEYLQANQTYYVLVDNYVWGNYFANCSQFDLRIQFTPVIPQPSCTNIGFSSNNFNGWFGTTGLATRAYIGAPTPNYDATALGIVPGRHTIMTGGNDPCGGFPRVDPLGGPFSVRLGDANVNSQAEQLTQTFMVSNTNNSFTYRYAVVFEDPGHTSNEQPFFRALLRDQSGNVIPCSEFVVSAAGNLPGFFNSPNCLGVRYKPWSTVNVDLSNYIGQAVTAEFTTGDCAQGAHYGYAYIDAACSQSFLEAYPDTICVGESATLTAPNGYQSYLWLPGNQTTQSITVTPNTSTTYQLNLVAFNGCVSSIQIPVVVVPYPTVTLFTN
jgi:hypothetical protein